MTSFCSASRSLFLVSAGLPWAGASILPRGPRRKTLERFQLAMSALFLSASGGLTYCDSQISDLTLDFLVRQHVQTAHESLCLDHRSLRAVETLERRV
jgi:hypothetical protein